jgi:hypothetical protein
MGLLRVQNDELDVACAPRECNGRCFHAVPGNRAFMDTSPTQNQATRKTAPILSDSENSMSVLEKFA